MSRTLQWSVLILLLGGCSQPVGPRVVLDATRHAARSDTAGVDTAAPRPGATPDVTTAAPRPGATTDVTTAVADEASDPGPATEAIRLLRRLATVTAPEDLDAVVLPGRPVWVAARRALAAGRGIGPTERQWRVEATTPDTGHGPRVVLRSGRQRISVHLTRLGGRWRIAEVVLLAPAAPRATAGGGGTIGGGPGGGMLTVGLTVTIDGKPAVPANSRELPRPYRVVATPAYDANDPLAGLCPNPSGWSGFGWWWIVDTVDRTSGAVVASRTQCVGLPGPGTIGSGPVPAQPPTVGEIWDQVALVPPTLGLSPPDRGVTGLETRIWSTSPTTARISAAIGPWRIDGVARHVGTAFDAGDGVLITRPDGGSEQRPAFRHVFERTGTARIAVGAVWTATVTLSGPGLPARTTPIGTAVISVAADYPVDEVRSVLVG